MSLSSLFNLRRHFNHKITFILAACLVIASFSSCKHSSSAGTNEGSEKSPTSGAKENAWAPLTPRLLQNADHALAIITVPDETPRPGLLLEGGMGKGGIRNWLIVCDVPADLKAVPVACRGSTALITGWAQPISKLMSGLTLLSFTPSEPLTLSTSTPDPGGEGVHAIRLELSEPIEEQVLATLKTELESVKNEIVGYNEKIQAARDALSDRPPTGSRNENPMTVINEIERSKSDALRRRNRIEASVKVPFKEISVSEVAAAGDVKALEASGRNLENTVLVSDTGNVLARRWRDGWETLDSIRAMVAQEGGKAESAEISILPYNGDHVQVTCRIKLKNGLPGEDLALVAATQNDLELMGGGTLEERLKQIERLPMGGAGGLIAGSKNVTFSHSGSTRLWLKVFSGKTADPVLDELIVLTVSPGSSRVVAIWGKPPSPLIKLPPTPADVPADVLKDSQTLAASGTISDLVPAGDGSILMVQTDREPFWAALNLKSGKWMDMPWKATAETLLASVAGKIHLVNKATGGIETWDIATGKREGTKLLQVELPITAIAAPLANPEQPLIIADAKGIRFLDPANFHPVEIDDDLRDFLKPEAVNHDSIWLRVSGDGAIYQILGHAPNRDDAPLRKTILVSPSWRSVPYGASPGFVSSEGRQLSDFENMIDQAGTGWVVEIKEKGDQFPDQLGFVSISSKNQSDETKEIARIYSQRLFAAGFSQGRSRIPMADRRIYLNSRLGVLLIPAGGNLEWARIGLPDAGPVLPEFVFGGETVKIPLPPGTGHRITAASAAKIEVASGFASWTAPEHDSSNANTFTLVWTGELGSAMSRDFKTRLLKRPRPVELVSADGSKIVPLRPRGLLRGSGRITALAGSGAVVILEDGSVWNLSDCQQLYKMKNVNRGYLGDAERTYAWGQDMILTAYDLQSGESLGSVPLGDSVQHIITGMASHNPLLAVEKVGLKGFLLQIPKDLTRPTPAMPSTAPNPTDSELHIRLFVPRMESNASGSVLWDKGVLVSSNSGNITAKVYRYEDYQGTGGTPDASGKIIVDTGSMLNLGFNPPRKVNFSELPGAENAMGSLDESGIYLLLSSVSPLGETGFISIREVAKPHEELLKIRYPYGSGGRPRIISTTRTLCVSDGQTTQIYDLDIAKLAAQLGAR
jgi:hypothetical protein